MMAGKNSFWGWRIDLVAFIAAFAVGLGLYFGLHVLLDSRQWVVTVAILGVMVAYTLVVLRLPALRIRIDQAADNAYYLGLLFTLISMARALHDFGVSTAAPADSVARSSIEAIIANFGIALASTIAGIFLRLLLQQMRIDPAEIESVTRLELADASKAVRAKLDIVAIEIGQFHDELRQRSADLANQLAAEMVKMVEAVGAQLAEGTKHTLSAIGVLQVELADGAKHTADSGRAVIDEFVRAVDRLKSIEPPPLTLSRRLTALTKRFDEVGAGAEGVLLTLDRAAGSAEAATQRVEKMSKVVEKQLGDLERSHRTVVVQLQEAVKHASSALDSMGSGLQRDQALLAELEKQTRKSADEAVRVQSAAVEVLSRMTEVTRRLTTLLRDGAMSDADARQP
jgi:hypothetical protein